MRSLDDIAATATAANVRLQVNTDAISRASSTTADGLFHTPLLALAILVIAGARRAGLPTSDVATWTLATLVHHCEALRIARGRIQWSVLLRRRCADALVFLENVELITIRSAPTRAVSLSNAGRRFVASLRDRADEAGVLVRQLDRAHHAIDQGGLELL
jgi:hypothetical protein